MDIVRRLYGESEFYFWFMIGVGMVVLVVNVICFIFIWKYNNDEVYMRVSWIFLVNDVIVNFGVVIVGIFVMVLK